MAGAAEPGLEERVAKLEGRVEGFGDRFDALERRFDIVERRIDALDQKLDHKLTKHFQVLATMMTAVFVAVVGGLIAGFFALR